MEFESRLNASELMGPREPLRFSHEDHIRAADLKDNPGVCDDCHQTMRQAAVQDLGEKVFNPAKFAGCHLADAQGTALAFKSATDAQHASKTDGTFYHSDHLRQPAKDAA